MHSSHDRKTDPFYKPPSSVQKTSAEIINEARNSLRTLRTQRPFTPREDQRKLFGPLSSRTPDSRPPSAFSLHATNFDSSDSRPVSGTRLSPLPHKPRIPLSSVTDDDIVPTIPQPPSYSPVQKPSVTRARLLRPTSQGNLVTNSEIPQVEAGKISENTRLGTDCTSEEDSTSLSTNNPSIQLVQNVNVTADRQRSPETPSLLHSKKSRKDIGSKSRSLQCASKTEDTVRMDKAAAEATGNESETEWETDYWNENISPILKDLEAAEQDKNAEDLCSLCVKLQKTLEDGNMLGKRCKRRSIILKTMYKLVDIGSDRLCLSLAKIILALKVSGKNLLNICKLVFKISRSKNNDRLFQNDDLMGVLLEVLQNEDAQANSEAFLYCLGTIKFLSGNTALLSDLLRKQAVEILIELMKQIIHFNTSLEMASDMSHLLVQLTATLRNLADLSQSRLKFLACNALLDLCILLEIYINDKDICTNVSRILSKLSTYNDCCAALADCSRYYSVSLAVLNKHLKKQDLVVRIIFTLSNLTAKTNAARDDFYKVKGSIKTIINLLHIYCELDIKIQKSKSTEKEKSQDLKKPSEVEDVLIKSVSLLANLSVHPNVGKDLAADQNCISHLIRILEYKSIDECEELVINTVATLSNLSFYENYSSAITKRRLEISKLMFRLLLSNNMEGILEAARVFGNLSHYQDVREFIVENSVYKFLVTLLDSRHQNVCYFACGVVTNLASDRISRILLKEEGTITRLVECLRDFGPSDWQLATVVCKALWNVIEDINEAGMFIGSEETNTLLDLLASFLDEQIAQDCCRDADLLEYHKTCWEVEFKPVAAKLLDKIHSHHSYLERLPEPF
ncbi:PREDICTED: armadillo repeat-containing protein 2 [Nanorana parkeri]|uniref:armadillo repeat-containing protein 2 n=1 Tax=Nanorana parkeri TaxID=125878 RepID=UPI000853FFBF|nr:PREDICTED: armadillo repeat-containing protein 2 [Nanorana parkeri]